MMRITNSMMTSNTKNNININKLNEDKLNTQMATGQKISRPSDDPVIAIRALRLNTNLSQLNQYYEKNIPDAQAWLKVTETALTQTNQIFDSIKENLTTGASDTNTASDRMKLLTNLKGLRSEIYAAGNSDYAGRTVFTGYRTGESLTFLTTDDDKDANYKITQNINADSVIEGKYVNTGDSEYMIQSVDTYRIRLPYDQVKDENLTIKTSAGNITVYSRPITGQSQAYVDNLYTNPPLSSGYLIPETGEIVLGSAAAKIIQGLTSTDKASIEYNKDTWESGDLRPEHYFACVKTETKPGSSPVYYNYEQDPQTGKPKVPYTPAFEDQKIQVEISFNQKITINTNANKVFTHDVGRSMDDLLAVTQDVIDLDEKIADLKAQLEKAVSQYVKDDIQLKLDAANKEHALKKDNMQKMFSKSLDIFDGYADRNNEEIANIGNISSRLAITKDRVEDQIQNFKELANDNINISLTDTAIDLSNAELALQAAQMAAGKIAQQTLLNYL